MKPQIIKAVRGMQDIFPDEAARWVSLEALARDVSDRYGFGEIRIPLVESTPLFVRGIGRETDIVEKEMFSFSDAGGKELSLRPEGTAGVVRAYLEHGVYARQPVSRFFYLGPMFRRERPQAGRRRQFHQYGVEVLGEGAPELDVEVMDLLELFLSVVGVKGTILAVNSVGCSACREPYRVQLQQWLMERKERLCENCRRRLSRNPLRVLDCKNPDCREILADSPVLLDYVCPDCRSHHERVIAGLKSLGLPFREESRLVRGLDYYTRTVFEVYSSDLGAQDALAAGGRYDGLVEELGGPPTPAVGFSVGLERLLICLEGKEMPAPSPLMPSVYCVGLDAESTSANFLLAARLRRLGLGVRLDHSGRSLKSQLREANRLGVDFVLIRGQEELEAGTVKLKDMREGGEVSLPASPDEIGVRLSGGGPIEARSV